MNRYIKFILLTIWTLYIPHNRSFAQLPEDFSKSKIDWSAWKVDIADSIKLKTLKDIDYWLFKDYYKKYDHIKLENDLHRFNFLDFDLNGDLEIFYEGFIGGEPIGTIIFKLNSTSEYQPVFQRFGVIVSMWKNNIEGPIFIETILSPCCAGHIYSKETWQQNGFNFELIQKTNWTTETVFPLKFSNPIKFRVLNETYTLRSSPLIDEKNEITSYSKGDIGFAIGKESDSSGRIWWFVLMVKDNSKALFDFSYNENYYSLGWMSSNYLEIIKKEKASK